MAGTVRRIRCTFLAVAVLAGVNQAFAEEIETPQSDFSDRLEWNGGGDIRFRREVQSDVPGPSGAGQTQDYWRFRSRLFGEVRDPGRWLLRLRLAHEFFDNEKPKHSQRFHFPEELLIDELYLDVKNLWGDRVDLRIGRQSMWLGSGRLFGDGTPLDGSRTDFVDGIRITHRITPKLKADYFAIYNSPHADLTFGRAHGLPAYLDGDRPLVGIAATDEGAYDAGLGAYFRFDYSKALALEWYAIWKHEGDRKVGAEQRHVGGRDVFTVGGRILPRFTETLSAELEGAVQFGDTEDGQNLFAHMAYGSLNWEQPVTAGITARAFLAAYLLSGDKDAATGRDTNWNPLWGRYPQGDDLMVFHMNATYGMGYWTNYFYPHLGLGVAFDQGTRFDARTGYAYKPQADGLGGGSGHDLGWVSQVSGSFPIVKSMWAENRGNLTGGFVFAAWKPADYCIDDNWAYFLRLQLVLAF